MPLVVDLRPATTGVTRPPRVPRPSARPWSLTTLYVLAFRLVEPRSYKSMFQADFCLWGSPTADGVIGDVEAAVVAYCTKPGHGTRIIPAGAITAAQVCFY